MICNAKGGVKIGLDIFHHGIRQTTRRNHLGFREPKQALGTCVIRLLKKFHANLLVLRKVILHLADVAGELAAVFRIGQDFNDHSDLKHINHPFIGEAIHGGCTESPFQSLQTFQRGNPGYAGRSATA